MYTLHIFNNQLTRCLAVVQNSNHELNSKKLVLCTVADQTKGPIDNRTHVRELNAGLGYYSDLHCILSIFQQHQFEIHSGHGQDLTDPLCIIKKEVFEQDHDVDQDMDENVNDYLAGDFMENSHDDNGVPYGVDGVMNDENLKIYIDEALQVTLNNYCQTVGI